MTEIEQTIKSLSRTYNVKTRKDDKLSADLAYDAFSDAILYNPKLIKYYYNELSKIRRITLEECIAHSFGHELGHRKKHMNYGLQKALEKATVLLLFINTPEKAINLLPEEKRIDFPLYRAAAIAFLLFQEYYAENNNPLYSPNVALAELSHTLKSLKANREKIRQIMHSLILFPREIIENYFITPLVLTPTRYFRIFPQEFPTLRKIKTYLETQITTPNDVFNTDKMEELANILLYEL